VIAAECRRGCVFWYIGTVTVCDDDRGGVDGLEERVEVSGCGSRASLHRGCYV